MPLIGGVTDPTLSKQGSGSSPRAYRDETDEDDNPYAPVPRHRMSRQLSGYGRPPGKVDKCPSCGKDTQQSAGKNAGQPSRHRMPLIRSL